ncbi:MAG: SDR family oxidoreductase [Proteobacteria bacterium]|nr:SDR family oxidoreductase [Pseudomonadota bacterium]MDA1354752.1 SDR family oxidoreductase [Pseudomonadota bacterium]
MAPAFPEPRAALVTGAGQRIGRAIAIGLGAAGWSVAVHYRDSADNAAETVERIEAGGGKALALAADLSNERETMALASAAAGALGPLGCLVNNASLFEYDNAESVTRESWDAHMSVNLRAPFLLAQAFAAGLPSGAAGAIINILDQRVWNLTPHFVSYTLSKSGLWTLTQTLALGLAPHIRVNAIGPGPVLPSARQTAEQFRAQAEKTPLGHGAEPGEISDAVLFILAAPALTGQMMALDGGQHLGWSMPSDRKVEE